MKKISLIIVVLFFATTIFVACGGGEKTDKTDDTNIEKTDETKTDETTEETASVDGKAIFATHCVACHGSDGAGIATFPSLVDDEWLYGNTKEDIVKMVNEGNLEKGMTPYKDVLSAEEISAVSDYILDGLGK